MTLVGTLLIAWLADIGLLERGSSERVLFAGLALTGVLVALLFRSQSLEIPSKRSLILIGVMLGWPLLSMAWAGYVPAALYRSLKFVLAGAVFLIAFQIPRDRMPTLGRLFSVVLWVSVLYASAEWFFSGRAWTDIGGLFRHPNLLSSLLVMVSFPVAGLVFTDQRKWKLQALIILALTLCLLLLLQTRAAWLGLFCGSTFFGFSLLFKSETKTLGRWVSLANLGLLGVAFGVLASNPQLMNANSMVERSALWSNTLGLIQESPFIGVGAGNWQFEFTKFGVQDLPMAAKDIATFQSPHNDFLWMASELGLPFALLCSLALLWLVIRAFRSRADAEKNDWITTSVFLSSIIAAVVISCFSFPSDRVFHLMVLACLIAFLVKRASQVQRQSPKVSLLFIPLTMLAAVVGGCQLWGEYHTRQMIEAKAAEQFELLPEMCDKASSAFYRCDPMSTPLSSYALLGYVGDPNAHDQRMELLLDSKAISPYDPEILTNLGLEYMMGRDFVNAQKELEQAIEINPFNEASWLNLALVHFNQGEVDRAQECLQEIPQADQKYPMYYQRIFGR